MRLVGSVALAVVCWAMGLSGVEAASGDADGTYTVTITKVEASKDVGTTYTTIFSGSQDINIASVSAGARWLPASLAGLRWTSGRTTPSV